MIDRDASNAGTTEDRSRVFVPMRRVAGAVQ